MNFSQKEIQNLTEMLMGENDQGILTTLKLLSHATEVSHSVLDELVVVYIFNEDKLIREKTEALLLQHYSEGELQRLRASFNLFDYVTDYRPAPLPHIIIPLYGKYDLIRARYEPHLFLNDKYSQKYLQLAKILAPIPELVDIAKLLFETVINFRPSDPEGYSCLGIVFQFAYHDYEKALELLEHSLELDPENTEVHLKLGYLMEYYFHKIDKAIAYYETATDLDPQDIRAYIRLANSHYHFTKNFDRCKQYIDIILSKDPFHPVALSLLGNIFWKMEKNFKLALKTFQRGLLNNSPNSALLTANMAEFYVEGLDNYEMGKLFYQQSLDVEPGNRWRFEKMKQLLIERFNDYGLLKVYYENYLNDEPYDADMHYEFAHFILQYIHEMPLAERHLNKAIQLNPDHDEAKALLKQL